MANFLRMFCETEYAKEDERFRELTREYKDLCFLLGDIDPSAISFYEEESKDDVSND